MGTNYYRLCVMNADACTNVTEYCQAKKGENSTSTKRKDITQVW